MNKTELLAGAPIFRGRWTALLFLWISGFLAGDMDLGLVWVFVPDPPTTHTHWAIDIVMAILSFVFLVLGLICLDQYGRNSWFAWAPDDVKWGNLTRADVNRKAVFQGAEWIYNWRKHIWPDHDR
jgi:hypothetical protein